ncbi:DgyrCDS5360 [Dimorphilus gyrociliatus]|uniref:Coiled-coil domain-containing protein 93 n=1 Tax=Dimorphilus gyrociliatus TaxID=2664684 RepID=A0A7I8VJN5_9ANNE|nr:DgyrCDS5360 [Dimorphilus gyrociliatus]
MASVTGTIFPSASIKRDLTTVTDQDGYSIKFDIREDEEQSVKLNKIIEYLLAAGYFRARIKGLSAFDKVVGGMSWCITTCNVDLDVDLLFQENSTIGQKIALTEKIVRVLPKMKCPHRIEPHQIQGLDFIHIFPVIQWLVKKAIETREETGNVLRAFSVSQFNKSHALSEEEENKLKKSLSTLSETTQNYKPKRVYKRRRRDKDQELSTRVQFTLLEYGQFNLDSNRLSKRQESGQSEAKKKAIAAGLEQKEEGDDSKEIEKEKLKSLMEEMSVMEGKGRLSSAIVGNLVSSQTKEIHKIVSEYEEKLKEKHDEMKIVYDEAREEFEKKQEINENLEEKLVKFHKIEEGQKGRIVKNLSNLVIESENLKRKEEEFREECRKEKDNLEKQIKELEESTVDFEDPKEKEHLLMIEEQLGVDNKKLHKARLQLAKVNRDISSLQRKLDEAPSRAELAQYQRRFVELYNQIAARHKETKQFYTLYNTLQDSKQYLTKEINLLNSIYDNFEEARMSQSGKEQFLKQFENMVDGVKQNRSKLERRREEEKLKRDKLNEEFLELIDKGRTYFKLIRDFQEECRRNELLTNQLEKYV